MLAQMLMSDSSDGWLGHSLGLERLMELRGPESFRQMPDRALLESSRPGIIFAGIVLHKNTIMSDAIWKTIPWKDDTTQKQPFQYLIDILADCPPLFVLKDQIYASPTTEEALLLATELEQRTQPLLAQLEVWKAAWDVSQGDYYHETPVTSSAPFLLAPSGVTIPFWTTNIQYTTLRQANAVTIYYATIILLLKLLQEMSINYGITTPPHLEDTMYMTGIEICRSVEYHLNVMREGSGSFYLLYPLRMVWDAVGKFEPIIGRWLTDVLNKIQSGAAGRWAIAGYILDINASTPEQNQDLMTEVSTPNFTDIDTI